MYSRQERTPPQTLNDCPQTYAARAKNQLPCIARYRASPPHEAKAPPPPCAYRPRVASFLPQSCTSRPARETPQRYCEDRCELLRRGDLDRCTDARIEARRAASPVARLRPGNNLTLRFARRPSYCSLLALGLSQRLMP